MKTIAFQGRDDLCLVGDTLEEGGPIATLADYEAGRVSYAHLSENGDVMRYGAKIGCREDITITGECKPNVTMDSLIGILLDGDGTWANVFDERAKAPK